MVRTLYADDCLDVLKNRIPPASVDLIYLDPPFNSNSNYNLPFKGKYKSAKPVTVFKDTWDWGDSEQTRFDELRDTLMTRHIADLVSIARSIDGLSTKNSMGAYLINMYDRLEAMRGVLKPTGSIYLHCDPTASHYLKLLMDAVFGKQNFRNEIIWCYERGGRSKTEFANKHDTLLFYSCGPQYRFNPDAVRLWRKKTHMKSEIDSEGREWQIKKDGKSGKIYRYAVDEGALCLDWWDGIQQLNRNEHERLGYPTQKPLLLLDRIILASSNEGDTVLDPFCGCGTSIHAAEELKRHWIGIDISAFSAELVRNRIVLAKLKVKATDIAMLGVSVTLTDARRLAKENRFEFEKWACGHVGAEGMFHEPGTKGPDRGVDGVLKFVPLRWGQQPKPEYAIIQVKSGKVTPDSVRALQATVENFEATAGVIVCFKSQEQTVENNRIKKQFKDATGSSYPYIQGLFVEDMLKGVKPNLPNIMGRWQ